VPIEYLHIHLHNMYEKSPTPTRERILELPPLTNTSTLIFTQRLDSFAELIASSIEYGESTSHQLQPTKSGPLNVPLLRSIEALVLNIRERQAWKASGASTDRLRP
jgi:hypothetical protein